MRLRLVIVAGLAALLGACAVPEFRLDARIGARETREYRLVADAEVRIAASSVSSVERTRLEAKTTVTTQSQTAAGTVLLLTITPVHLQRNGNAATVPAAQQVLIEVAGGRVTRVTNVEGSTELETAALEDLVPLIGPPLPPGRVHLGDRWTATPASPAGVPAGVQQVRLAALRVVGGYDCAVVALSTRRPVVQERTIGGTPLRLQGVEFGAGEIAFAFREGMPVSLRSTGEARLGVSGATASGGSVVIRTVTTLTLLRRSQTP